MTATRIAVGGERPYDVVVGTGVLIELASLLGPDGLCAIVAEVGYSATPVG